MENITNGTTPLSKRLEEPEVAAAINRLLDRIDALENTVDTLNLLVKEGPGFTAMATDIIDETAKQAANAGVRIEDRMRNAMILAERATSDDSVEAMKKAIEFVKEAPGFVAMVADMFDEHVRTAAQEGLDVESRIKGALQLAIQLTDPGTLSSLQSVLSVATQAPGFIAMATDIVDEQTKGEDINARISGLLSLGDRMTDPCTTGAMEDILSPGAVNTVGMLSKALAEQREQGIDPVGPVGLMRKLRDPDIKRAVGFLLGVAKSIGQELKK